MQLLRQLSVTVTAAIILSGCSEVTPESVLENYRDRVANVLDSEVTAPPEHHFPAFPDKRDRVWPIQDLRTGLLDSMELGDCDLLPLVVERNSSLGKVMTPSALLSYELRFFEKLHPCQLALQSGELESEEGFKSLINTIFQVKAENLDAVVWNGIFSSDEVSSQFSHSKGPIPLTGNSGFQDSLRSLNYLIAITKNAEEFEQLQTFSLPNELPQQEDYFFNLYSSEYGGQLQSSLKLLIKNLNQTADLINRKLDDRPLCFKQRPNEKAEILLNVFNKFYAGEVQPYMSLIHREGQLWMEAMNVLLSFGGDSRPTAMQTFFTVAYDLNSPTSYWSQYQAAIQVHTKAWQRVLTQCGLMPK